MNDAFVEMAKDMLIEAKRQNKRLFCALIISICIIFTMVIAFFIWFNSVDTAVTTTTIEQAADTGNNVYQSGAEATYNEGGELNS